MFWIIFSYLVSTFFVLLICSCFNQRTYDIKNLVLKNFGLVFYSNTRHRIKVGNVKFLQIENMAYLKNNEKLVIIKNVEQGHLHCGYFYFRACGQTEIIFNCSRFYRYFNLEIHSPKFDLKDVRAEALTDLTNNLFDLNKSVRTKKYISILKNILKINITENSLTISKNLYNLPFTLIYKSKNKIKKINVL